MSDRLERNIFDAVLAVVRADPAAADELRAALSLNQPHQDEPERWMSSHDAATYLGLSANALHKLTAARAIPFEQDGPGCKLWFRRTDLDRWRQGGGDVHSLSSRAA